MRCAGYGWVDGSGSGRPWGSGANRSGQPTPEPACSPTGAAYSVGVFVVEVAGRRLAVEPLDLACCAVEVASARHALGSGVLLPDGDAAEPLADDPVEGPVDAYVLLVAGTVTRAGAGAVRARFEALPEPRRVVAYGACATTGGPYWDSYAVVPGVAELMPVDVVVPGCPPPPSSVLEALAVLAAALPAAPRGPPVPQAGAR